MSSIQEEVNTALRNAWNLPEGTTFPPPLHEALNLRWTAHEPKRHLQATCVFPESWAAFDGVGGGGLGAAFETVAQSFACLLAHKRCALLNLECTTLRHLKPGAGEVEIETQIRATRKSVVFIEGVLRDHERQVLAHASATYAALKSDRPNGE